MANDSKRGKWLMMSSLIAWLAISSAAVANQQAQPPVSPEAIVREFYDWYLHASYPEPKKSNLAKFRKYITQRFLKQAMDPEVDAVLFIDAQDADPAWANNISLSTATIRGQQAIVQVTLKGQGGPYKLRVTLRRESGAWKIDNVKGSD